MTPFARLLGGAEVNLGEISRRLVDSVTLPVKVKSQEVIGDITQSLTATLRTLAIRIALAVFALVMMIIALAYGLSALHAYLVTITGPIEATLIMAGVFALLAILAVATVLLWPKSSARAEQAALKARNDAAEVMATARAQAAAASVRAAGAAEAVADEPVALSSTDLRDGLGMVASALGEAGLRKEQAGLKAGLALAEQLKPIQLVALALIGGFVAGMRLSRRR